MTIHCMWGWVIGMIDRGRGNRERKEKGGQAPTVSEAAGEGPVLGRAPIRAPTAPGGTSYLAYQLLTLVIHICRNISSNISTSLLSTNLVYAPPSTHGLRWFQTGRQGPGR